MIAVENRTHSASTMTRKRGILEQFFSWSLGLNRQLTTPRRMHDNYDVKGRVHRIEQRAQSVESLKNLYHLPDFDSFDVEFSPIGQVLQQTMYTLGAKVHGSKHFVYGELGELVRTLEFDGAGNQLGSTDFQCDSEGRCVGWTGHDCSGVLTRRCIKQYAGELFVSLPHQMRKVLRYYRRISNMREEIWLSLFAGITVLMELSARDGLRTTTHKGG